MYLHNYTYTYCLLSYSINIIIEHNMNPLRLRYQKPKIQHTTALNSTKVTIYVYMCGQNMVK